MGLVAINPATGQTIHEYAEMTPQQVRQVLGSVQDEYLRWRRSRFEERARLLAAVGQVLAAQTDRLARLMTLEMGKAIREARAEVQKCAWVCEYYAQHAESFLQPEPVETDAARSFVTFRPLGVILAVMPWNFPFWQVFRFAAPALMAGNTAVLKHASNVPGCALAIEGVFREAGFPEHAFRTLLIGSAQVSSVIEHPIVKAVTLTGSTPAGKAVAQTAGSMLKKTVLELGGSDPYVILSDADLDKAVRECVTGRLINAGQSCIAAKRFVVVEALRERFATMVTEQMAAARMGDPLKEETTLGPQARQDLRDELHEQVALSVRKGARCLLGGKIPDLAGAYYPATVLSDVKKGMPAYDEELFGPVAAIIPVPDDEEAVRVANDTEFGLGAAVFSENLEMATRIAAEELEAGCCFVNAFVRSDPRLPFGGVKASGYGRELSHYGIKEFVNIKTVYVA